MQSLTHEIRREKLMAGPLYDYIAAVVIVGVLFVSLVVVMPNISYINLLYVDQQQLRNIALEALKTMLLDNGYPVDWGSMEDFNQSKVQRFGLAYADGSSFYILDPDKVQRLNRGNSYGWVEYETARKLLGLEGYGFKLSIIPPFNVTISDRSFEVAPAQANISLGVKVSRHDGRPLANAAAQTTFIYSIYHEAQGKSSGNVTVRSTAAETAYTDSLGICEINGTCVNPIGEGWEIKDVIAILRVTVADLVTVVAVYQSINNPAEIIDVWMIEDNITMMIPVNELYPFDQPQEADWVWDVLAYYGEGDLSQLYRGTGDTDKLNWGQGSPYKIWSRTIRGLKSSDPALIILTLSCVPKNEGRRPLLIAGPSPDCMGFKLLNFGGTPRGTTVRVQRTVIISGITYIAEMTLWKESV